MIYGYTDSDLVPKHFQRDFDQWCLYVPSVEVDRRTRVVATGMQKWAHAKLSFGQDFCLLIGGEVQICRRGIFYDV